MPAEPETCANPLLLSWVKEWWDLARDRHSKGEMVYKKAYNSLKACPMKFTHPSEVEVLQGFGPKLVARLVKKMEDFCDTNGLPKPKKPKKKRTLPVGENGEEGEETASPSPKKKARKLKPYVPGLRSGAYAIIMALSTLDEDSPGITKAEVIRLAQPHSNASFTVPENAGKHYTAWNSISTLKDKQLVHERGRPAKRYILTEEGWDVAKRIKKTADPNQGHMDTFVSSQRPAQENDDDDDDNFQDLAGSPIRSPRPSRPTQSSTTAASVPAPDIIPQGPVVTNPSTLPDFDPIILEPGSYRIELVVDKREIFGTKTRDYMEKNLTEKGVVPIMRELKLGDVLWVAKMHDPKLLERRGLEGDEVMLDYIVERKRLDDLVSSIKDGRFHEQKFRLRKSGVKNVVYLIEEISNQSDTIRNMREAISTAITSSQVIDGYFVKQTQKMDDTIDYLVRMTKLLKQRYEHRPLHIIPTNAITMSNYIPLVEQLKQKDPGTNYYVTYDVFACLGSKSETLTLRDVYLKMLMCTKGLTGQKAIELQRKWKTPIDFIEAYSEIEAKYGTGEEGKKRKWAMVSDAMDNPIPRKRITKAISTKIAEVWGDASTAMV
ncbi:related to Crossover junction endonuclease MUS81 [Phialocephala subalpina]|uniref:Crossover junction endonuclease MUS81 n=1 Tax=Phialocephala subalpina TaxID=576137 RepID=A0A1L7XA60_9HELO|nr:related to Crossover junction endonuclease MUS81 [Phialocephala subalpina]